jgi:hypothetical protein
MGQKLTDALNSNRISPSVDKTLLKYQQMQAQIAQLERMLLETNNHMDSLRYKYQIELNKRDAVIDTLSANIDLEWKMCASCDQLHKECME